MKNIPSIDIRYVTIQVILFIIYFVPVLNYTSRTNSLFKFIALLFVIAGVILLFIAFMQLNKNLTPFPTPLEDGTLIQNGLYKFIRHPIYTGFILTSLGYGIFTGSVWKILIGIALWILFYFKSRYEERLLEKKYPEYKMYKKEPPGFFLLFEF